MNFNSNCIFYKIAISAHAHAITNIKYKSSVLTITTCARRRKSEN